ncbi:MAG: phosphatase PAP2 family protein [Clostridia bacterium]|nr:phosphatase PAP2 family protein [Clostridia bacterium]
MDEAFLELLEGIRCPFLTVLMCIFTLLGQELILVAVIAAVYFAVDKRFGERAAITVLTAASLNGIIKEGVKRPRPYVAGVVSRVEVDNFLVSTNMSGSYSFPSGHSMNSAAFFGQTALSVKRKWVSFTCLAVTLLIMLSRLYLGVDYPTDVLVGGALGFTIAVGFSLLYNKSETLALSVAAALSVAFSLTLFFMTGEDTFSACGAMVGCAFGILSERKFIRFSMPDKWWKGVIRVALGLVVILGLRFGLKLILPALPFFRFLRYALMIFVGIGVYPLCFKKLKI